ncbi:MAG TPA: hypothetical protein VKV95_19210 [Terriglobia bacterium]|nr:hypothetical protein [Terriglobia bacterium]
MKQENVRPRSETETEADPSLNGLVEVALEIASRRRETLKQLRAALESGNNSEALNLAKELCGLHEESDRTHSRIN